MSSRTGGLGEPAGAAESAEGTALEGAWEGTAGAFAAEAEGFWPQGQAGGVQNCLPNARLA